MSPQVATAGPERGVDFDVARFASWLDALLGASREPLEVARAEGGMSNPTYFLRHGDWERCCASNRARS